MNSLNIKEAIIFFIVSVGLIGWLIVTNFAEAANTCDKLTVRGEVYITGPLIPGPIAVGSVFYSFEDGSTRIGQVTADLTKPPKLTEDGDIHLALEILHAFSNGDTLRWMVSPVLSPTDDPTTMTLNERILLLEGSGAYAGAMGRGTGHGYVSFLDGQIVIEGKGMLCTGS